MSEHEQVVLYPPWQEEPVEVDAGIAFIIKELWSFGIETWSSCQGGPNEAWFVCCDARADQMLRFKKLWGSDVLVELEQHAISSVRFAWRVSANRGYVFEDEYE